MKKLALIALIAAAILFLSACIQDPFEEYENFVNDLDISARIEDAINSASQGDTSPFFVGEVQTLYEDLGTFAQQDESAHIINEHYSSTVQLVLDAINARESGDAEQSRRLLDRAQDTYRDAQNLYEQFLVHYNHNNARQQ